MEAEIKPISGTNRTKLSEVIPLSTPFSIFVFPTTHCNFKCVYCGHSLGYDKMQDQYDFIPQNMSIMTYKKVIKQIKQFPKKLKMLSLTGQGEPMINKNLPLMIKLAKEADIAERIEIISNGSLLSQKLADDLIEAGLDTLKISLQGLSSNKYKEICKAAIDFNSFLRNIKYFYNHRNNTKLFIKIMDVSLEEGEEDKFYKLFGEYADRIFVEKMLPAYEGVEITKKMDVDYDRYGRKHKKRKVCPLPFYMLGIFPNGDVEPCDTIYKPILLGNIYQDDLVDMWNGRKLKEFWKMQLRGQRVDNNKCCVCCAPDDVAHPEDVLDDNVGELLKLLD